VPVQSLRTNRYASPNAFILENAHLREKEVNGMFSTLNETQAMETPSTLEKTEMTDGVRFARYLALEELPGLIFGLMTVAYVVLSLLRPALWEGSTQRGNPSRVGFPQPSSASLWRFHAAPIISRRQKDAIQAPGSDILVPVPSARTCGAASRDEVATNGFAKNNP
jgi:hypothetical protein